MCLFMISPLLSRKIFITLNTQKLKQMYKIRYLIQHMKTGKMTVVISYFWKTNRQRWQVNLSIRAAFQNVPSKHSLPKLGTLLQQLN